MLKFISETANDTNTKKYMFGAQGMLSHLPSRITPTLNPSVTIYAEMMVIIKSIGGSSQNTVAAVEEAFQAFDLSTWAAIFGVIVFLVLLSVAMSYVHTGSVPATTVFDNLCGIVDEETDDTVGHNRVLRRTTVSLLGASVYITCILVLLFYEIGVANFIFNERPETLSKPLRKFTNKELESFLTLPGSSMERILAGAVGRKFEANGYPWQGCSHFRECLKRLIDPTDSANYLMTGITNARYGIKTARACGKATILDTWTKPEYAFHGSHGFPSGWYFSTAIPDDTAQQLNRELLEIKLNGKLQQIHKRWVGNDDGRCAQKKLSIAVQVLMLPFMFLAGPMVCVTLTLLIRLTFVHRGFRLKPHGARKNNGTAASL